MTRQGLCFQIAIFVEAYILLSSHLIFLKQNKGTIKESVIRPRLTEDNKASQLVFSVMCKEKIKGSKKKKKAVTFYYCFLDEKWFYCFTNRKKTKNLPPFPGENLDDVFVPPRRVRSR